jgi:hypothetical protein
LTYEVDWEPPAVDLASRYLLDDPEGLRAVLAAVDSLAEDPRPAGAFPLGATRLLATKPAVKPSPASSRHSHLLWSTPPPGRRSVYSRRTCPCVVRVLMDEVTPDGDMVAAVEADVPAAGGAKSSSSCAAEHADPVTSPRAARERPPRGRRGDVLRPGSACHHSWVTGGATANTCPPEMAM